LLFQIPAFLLRLIGTWLKEGIHIPSHKLKAMKKLIWILPLLVLLACKPEDRNNDKDKDNDGVADRKENNDPPQANTKADEPGVYIAFREDANGTVYLRDTDEDIDRLIVDLRPLDVEVDLLDRGYWRDNRCRQMSARKCVQGDCVAGNCEQVVLGGWTVCRCKL
jgi:hypothetical protein